MIGTEFLDGQGLGNQLFCYVSARCIALSLGCRFGTANQEQLAVNIHSGKGMYFMDMDLGERIEYADPAASRKASRTQEPVLLTPDGQVMTFYHEKEQRLYLGTAAHDLTHGCYIAGADEALLTAAGADEALLAAAGADKALPADRGAGEAMTANAKARGLQAAPADVETAREGREQPPRTQQAAGIGDNTLLCGNLQDERYFGAYREQIREWLRVRPEYDSHEFTRDNLCVLNLRGGEYTGHPELYLRRQYWLDAMRSMRRIRPDMEFIISTDDTEAAGKLLPGLPAIHRNLDQDYTILKNARYLILSNSSFAFFPAYTSETLEYAIAPKYWARHNVSDGYWASEQNIYSIFHYQDRAGRLFTPEECRAELETYKRTSRRYASAGERPRGATARLGALEAKARHTAYYGGRAWYSLRRRAGYRVPYAEK